MINTPQLDKISEVKDESQAIGDFLEWLRSNGYHICEWVEYTESGRPRIEPILVETYLSTNNLLARYYEIDEDAAEAERRAILDNYRKQVHGNE